MKKVKIAEGLNKEAVKINSCRVKVRNSMKTWTKSMLVIGLLVMLNIVIGPSFFQDSITSNGPSFGVLGKTTLRTTMNESVPAIGADEVWTHFIDLYHFPVTGEGVVAGIVDTGVDYRHPDFFFLNRSARYTIVQNWLFMPAADLNGNGIGDPGENLFEIDSIDGPTGWNAKYDWLYLDRNLNGTFDYGTDYYALAMDENEDGDYNVGETVVLLTESKILEIIDMTTGQNWTQAQIEAGTAATYDFDGHGTNVAGIAAGGQVTEDGKRIHQFTGVAPNANLVIVKIGDHTENLYNDTELFNAITMIAEKNIDVLSLSLGAYIWRNLDGTSAIETLIDSLNFPVVVAAGNLQNKFVHRSDYIPPNSTIYLPFISTISGFYADAEPTEIRWDVIWDVKPENLIFKINYHGPAAWPAPGPPFTAPPPAPSSLILGVGTPIPQTAPIMGLGVLVTWWRQDSSTTNMFCVRMNHTTALARDQWSIEINSTIGTTIQSYIWDNANQFNNNSDPAGSYPLWAHWGYIKLAGTPNTYQIQANPNCTVTHPATATNAIAVGSFDLKTKNLSPFSSLGSTDYNSMMDGYQKPDICAPGDDTRSHGIKSSVSRNATKGDLSTWTSHNNTKYGTSQAAPHVAGTIALMLQKNGTLSISEIKTILRETAVNDTIVGAAPNLRWGYGKLNATAAVQSVVLYLPGPLELPWWALLIIIGGIVLVVALIVVIRTRKKRKTSGA